MIRPSPKPTPDSVAAHLALFVAPDQVTELRALHVGAKGRTFAGWFTGSNLREMARQALALSREAAGVYFIPNPVNPELLARRPNAVSDVRAGKPKLTHDSDIIERRYLLVDLDPSRAVGHQANPTNRRELGTAYRIARRDMMPYLRSRGWADPVVMSSGSGIHLVYRYSKPLHAGIVGPRDPAAQLLAHLGDRYDCLALKIDPNTYNPTRMLKVPGTVVRRGDPSPSRPHRTARIVEVPDGWYRNAAAVG